MRGTANEIRVDGSGRGRSRHRTENDDEETQTSNGRRRQMDLFLLHDQHSRRAKFFRLDAYPLRSERPTRSRWSLQEKKDDSGERVLHLSIEKVA